MTIYIDILIVINLYINYFVLKICAKLLHQKVAISRCILTSFVGSICSLIIFLPNLDFYLILIIKIIFSMIFVLLSFGKCKIIVFIKNTVFYFAVYFIFAGVLQMIIQSGILPSGFLVRNMTVYYPISSGLLIAVTLIIYAVISIMERFLIPSVNFEDKFSVEISYGTMKIEIKGLADTGNTLVDCFSGKPVIVAGRKNLMPILDLPENANICETLTRTGQHLKGFRIIPYSTCSSKGMILVFRPEKIIITDKNKGISKNVDALIGVGMENEDAIFNPKLLI